MLADKKKMPNGRLQSQAQRYNKHFGGQGAFVFARGFCQDLSLVVTGALLLDAKLLDMSSIEAYQDAATQQCSSTELSNFLVVFLEAFSCLMLCMIHVNKELIVYSR